MGFNSGFKGLTMLLQIIFFLFLVMFFDHHTPFNAPIIFRACVTLWPIFLVSLPSVVNMVPRQIWLSEIHQLILLIFPIVRCFQVKRINATRRFGRKIFPLPPPSSGVLLKCNATALFLLLHVPLLGVILHALMWYLKLQNLEIITLIVAHYVVSLIC